MKVVRVRFNKEQVEGTAKLLDTLAAASLITGFAGIFGYSDLTLLHSIVMTLTFVSLALAAFYIRRTK
jgi:hypothetical protein